MKSPNFLKVAVVGAGINGLYLAWKISEKGHKVEVFERKNAIGKEACSGLFSEKILKFIPESKKLIQNEINFALIRFPQKTIRVNFGKRFFAMSHAELDRLTAGLAESFGVKIHLNQNVTRSVLVILEEKFDKIIGCDGVNSEVRKFLRMPEPEYRLGILGFIPQKNNSNFVETWPVKNGFIWKIPRGEKTEYGIIAPSVKARELLEEFLNKNQLYLEEISSALIPQGFIIPKNDKITLCGDAAGLTKPWSGGGVVWGLEAAGLLLNNFPNLIGYGRDAKRTLYCRIIFSKLITKIVYFLGFNFPRLLPKKIKIKGDSLRP